MEVKGVIHEIFPTEQVNETLKKRVVILEVADNPQYPEYIKFEAIQERCNLLDVAEVGIEATVSFNLKGRPWTDKTGKKTYFNSLQLWRIEYGQRQAQAAPVAAPEISKIGGSGSASDDDDLPF